MEDQDKRVAEAVSEISQAHWDEQNSPLLLSALPPILERKTSEYRTVLGPRTLKAFIKETGEVAGYKLVEHPTQPARVGVVPAAAHYEFPLEPAAPPKTTTARSNQEATLAFFRALATLPDDDLEKVVIPVSVFVKLLK
jgi:hypothetical protein